MKISPKETFLILQSFLSGTMYQNPEEAGKVDEPEHYVYNPARDYTGGKGLLEVELFVWNIGRPCKRALGSYFIKAPGFAVVKQ